MAGLDRTPGLATRIEPAPARPQLAGVRGRHTDVRVTTASAEQTMVICRDRYLDDRTRYHLTLELRTRTGEMHSLLSAAGPEVHDKLGAVIVRALDEAAALLAERVAATAAPPQTTSFGCGT
jgi:hypothetical protein